jgi:hypothetical protein
MWIGAEDRAMRAVVRSSRALFYTDAPGFVRAGSGLCRLGRWLAIVQDDANYIALVSDDEVRRLELPAGEGGARIFESRLGNKGAKWDLESCVVVVAPDGVRWLLGVGSGSRPARCRVVLARIDEAAGALIEVRVVPLPALYAALAGCAAFAGGELNMEGAAWLGDRLRLFNRGNGDAALGAQVDASVDVSWPMLWAHILDPEHAPAPHLERVAAYSLGALDGVRLTFTDAAVAPDGRVLFLASAEDSPDAYDDGEVRGAAVGVFEEGAAPRWARVVDGRGAALTEKFEGLVVEDGRAWALVDADDPDLPSRLYELELVW